jgi:hypothetical protein
MNAYARAHDARAHPHARDAVMRKLPPLPSFPPLFRRRKS